VVGSQSVPWAHSGAPGRRCEWVRFWGSLSYPGLDLRFLTLTLRFWTLRFLMSFVMVVCLTPGPQGYDRRSLQVQLLAEAYDGFQLFVAEDDIGAG